MKIGFIGCGNMACGLIKGLLDKKIVKKGSILASDIDASRLRYIKNKYNIKINNSNRDVARNCEVIILAVKPQHIDEALLNIYNEIDNNKTVISIAAGIKIKHIQNSLPESKIVRVMPNAPALINSGVTAICKSKSASTKDYNLAKKIFASVGKVIEVDESLMDVVTATSGSGPAYFFLLMDAMVKAATSLGLNKKIAKQLVLNTALGASLLALKSDKGLKELIKTVASKGGTTEAALKVFNKKKFCNIVKEAIGEASKRSKELSKKF